MNPIVLCIVRFVARDEAAPAGRVCRNPKVSTSIELLQSRFLSQRAAVEFPNAPLKPVAKEAVVRHDNDWATELQNRSFESDDYVEADMIGWFVQ